MVTKLRVGIVCGGSSPEHEISLKSARNIVQIIDKRRFEIVVLLVLKDGSWRILNNEDDVRFLNWSECSYIPILSRKLSNRFELNFQSIDNLSKLDIIFPIIHGALGEDGSLQGFLEILDIPYVGSDVLGSSVCINKDITKHVLRDFGLSVVPFETFLKHDLKKINFYDIVDVLGMPLLIKPVNQGSSIGISWVDTEKKFYQALNVAFSYSHKIIIEPFISGKELSCAILGNNYFLKSSVCGEIVLKNNIYTYHDKYVQHDSEIIIPANIDDSISNEIRDISMNAFRTLNCFGMARVDLFLTLDNQIFINEINTLPGFTENSMYPKLWKVTGLDPQLLITTLIELSLNR